MTDAEHILKAIQAAQDKIEPMPDVAVLTAWERGYRSGLKVAETIARSRHKAALAMAGDTAGLAEAERLYPDPSYRRMAAALADQADRDYQDWTPSVDADFGR